MRVLAVLLLVHLVFTQAVEHKKFRDCAKTGFCRRNRARESDPFQSRQYEVDPSSVLTSSDGSLAAELKSGLYPEQAALDMSLTVLQGGTVRFNVREQQPKFERYEIQDILQPEGLVSLSATWTTTPTSVSGVFDGGKKVEVQFSPFQLSFYNGETLVMTANSDNLMTFEQTRDKKPKPDGATDSPLDFPYDVDGMWEEEFDGHKDTKPRGPEAIALDVKFVGSDHLFGIPEHAADFNLKTTKGENAGFGEPYRLWNLDVFEYELDVPMSLYGAVPFLISNTVGNTVGMLWFNAAETYIDVAKSEQGKSAHWISESGVIDSFFFLGPSPANVFKAYADLTGYAAMPQRFAVSYHQCRWNYKSEDDVAMVDATFDEYDIPYDVLWLDIEHTDGKKYFTWDKSLFPDPPTMQKSLAEKGRKMVTIIDPHIKRDNGYKVHTEAKDKDYYVHNSQSKGGVYEGWCWPGSVSYLDFLLPEVRDYWAGLFDFSKYIGSTNTLFTWNDMNEPSVFNGPEVTMPKDCLHMHDTVEHRDVHNLYGFYHHMSTDLGQVRRDNVRPFVLTRSFFSGSQKYGAVWTGDNKAEWSHLEAATPMLLSLNVAGITFSGADVGGFFGDPEVELLERWYQAAAFQPFFRAHAHIDTKRREPWLFGEPHTSRIRTAIRQRYKYLPYIYTTFFEAHATGMPVMRPLWVEFPNDPSVFGIEDQFLLGAGILVRPVYEKGSTKSVVHLPGPSSWYDVADGTALLPGEHTVSSPIDKTPVYQRGGVIVPKRERARRSSTQMQSDPYTLVVALDNVGQAEGHLYIDDGASYDFQNGAFAYRHFSIQQGVLRCNSATPPSTRVVNSNNYDTPSTVERVVVWGSDFTAATLTTKDGQQVNLSVSRDATTGAVTVRKPNTRIVDNWSISFK